MAKKRRSRRRRGKKRGAPVAAARSAPPREERRAEEAEPGVEAVALAEQYPHVYDDLKRIAILASIMFAILIILSFVIK